jgi:pimeloyl-ACP methyl ester carboxylesterase
VDGFIDANGVHTFYEVAGDGGDPVLFLHGGVVSGADYAPQRDALARRRTVILPDRRGHGRTPEVDGPMSYDLMTDDTIAFMDAIGLERAHAIGHSDGAIIALLLAIRHPDRVTSIAPISGNTTPDGINEESRVGLAAASVADFAASAEFFYTGDVRPTRSLAFFGRLKQMFLSEPDISTDDLARITVPALVVGADHDFVTIDDLAKQFRGIPNAQLAIVPGTGHELTTSHPDVVNAILERFLDEVPSLSAGPGTPDPPR